MLDPYKLVIVNIILSILLFAGVLIYRYVFPKRKINIFFLLVLIIILPTISVLRIGSYESGDFNIHVYRSISFYQSLSEGNIMPSWAKDLNATYGYPLFIFNYTLPYYIISFFHLIGFSFVLSMKLFLAINLILSGIFIYLFSKDLFKNKLAAFSTSIFYVFAPYHLVDLHFKVVIGEILFFTFLPLTFLFIQRLYKKNTILLICLLSISLTFLVLSHPAITFFAGFLMVAYILFLMHQDKWHKKPLFMIYPFLIAGIISLYSWGTPFFLSQYTGIHNAEFKTVYFPTIADLLYAPWRMGSLFQGPEGEVSNLIGYPHVLVIIITIFLIIRKKIPSKLRSYSVFWVTAALISIFLVCPYSKFIWENLSYLKVIGSHRLLIITAFTISVLAGYLTLNIKKTWAIYLLITVTIGITILNWEHRKVIPEITDATLKNNLPYSTSQGEGHFYANSRWADSKNPWFSKPPRNHMEIVTGQGIINSIARTSTKHIYNINSDTQLTVKENTLYFPGWSAKIKNRILPIYPDNQGLIKMNLPKGNYILELTYNDLPNYKAIKMISLISFIIIVSYIVLYPLFKSSYAKK